MDRAGGCNSGRQAVKIRTIAPEATEEAPRWYSAGCTRTRDNMGGGSWGCVPTLPKDHVTDGSQGPVWGACEWTGGTRCDCES